MPQCKSLRQVSYSTLPPASMRLPWPQCRPHCKNVSCAPLLLGACWRAVTPKTCWPTSTAASRWTPVSASKPTTALRWSGCCAIARVHHFPSSAYAKREANWCTAVPNSAASPPVTSVVPRQMSCTSHRWSSSTALPRWCHRHAPTGTATLVCTRPIRHGALCRLKTCLRTNGWQCIPRAAPRCLPPGDPHAEISGRLRRAWRAAGCVGQSIHVKHLARWPGTAWPSAFFLRPQHCTHDKKQQRIQPGRQKLQPCPGGPTTDRRRRAASGTSRSPPP